MRRNRKLDPHIEAVFQQILASERKTGGAELAAWKKPERDLGRLVRRDYVTALRRHLGYRELKALVSAVERVLSRVGRDDRAFESIRGMREITSKFAVHFRAEPYTGPEGLALLGFYMDKASRLLDRPLIYVNTAHVPLAVATAFCHEFGHYLTAQLFRPRAQPAHFFFDADYSSHLDDPAELAADALVSLRGYPRPVAEKIFATPWNWGLVARTGTLTGQAFGHVREHLKGAFGFDFPQSVPAPQNLHYLSGMIHYAKLRWAVLAEYDL